MVQLVWRPKNFWYERDQGVPTYVVALFRQKWSSSMRHCTGQHSCVVKSENSTNVESFCYSSFSVTVLVEKILKEETAQTGIQSVGATIFVLPRFIQIRDEQKIGRWERRLSSRVSLANVNSHALPSSPRVAGSTNDIAAHRASWLLPEESRSSANKLSAAGSERKSSDSIIPIPEDDPDLAQFTSSSIGGSETGRS